MRRSITELAALENLRIALKEQFDRGASIEEIEEWADAIPLGAGS